MKKIVALLLIAAALLSFVALPAQAQAEATLIGGFDVGPGGCRTPCIPYFDTAGRTWLSKIWSPLVSWNKDVSGLEPQLATAWEANADATEWTFKLREGVKWHDGEAFDAEDVKFSLELALNPEAATQYAGFAQFPAKSFVSIEVVDPMTVTMKFSAPAPRVPYHLIQLWILPQHALKDVKPADYQKSDWFFTKPVGTGPFMHDEYQAEQFWALKANPTYWRGAPKLARLINRYFKDEAGAVLALKSGEIQFTYASGDVALQTAKEPGYQLFSGPSGVTNYFIFNYRDPIFKDVRVRQAFLYAIDRKAITETVLQGTAQVVPCIGAFPAMYPGADKLNDYAYNPDKARQLLAEAGWEAGKSVQVVTYYDSQFHKDAMAAQQQFLAEVGVTMEGVFQDVPTYNGYFYTGEGWAISYRGIAANPGNFPFAFYTKGGQPTTDGAPLMGEEFPALNDLIAKAQVETDASAYAGLLQDICTFQNQNATEGYMWTAIRFGLTTDKAVNFYWFPGPGGGPYEDSAELWEVK